MKYGRSLSLCIKDILSGKVQEKEVAMIVTSTSCKNLEEWMDCIAHYHDTYYWKDWDYIICFRLVMRLLFAGKIHQPRLVDGKIQDLSQKGIWADSLEECFSTVKLWE